MTDFVDVIEIAAGDLFHAAGWTRVKVSRDGEARALRLPIRSAGVREALEAHARRRPRPPVVREVVRPGEPGAAELGVARATWTHAFDFTDAAYQAALAEHEAEAPLVALAAGLAVPILDEAGRPAEGIDARARALARLGLSTPQIERMVRDIRDLTNFQEEALRDFLPSGSEGPTSSEP